MKRIGLKELVKSLLHIEDTPERTAFAYAVGVFLGFSPFLGFHTLAGLAVAFLFRLNRVAILLGVWSNAPWWVIPYYTLATSAGMWLTGFRIENSSIRELLRLGMDRGFCDSQFWSCLASQWGFLWSFTVGSLILTTLLALAAYPLSRGWIRFYRHRRNP
jgi:uncharacterized protein